MIKGEKLSRDFWENSEKGRLKAFGMRLMPYPAINFGPSGESKKYSDDK